MNKIEKKELDKDILYFYNIENPSDEVIEYVVRKHQHGIFVVKGINNPYLFQLSLIYRR